MSIYEKLHKIQQALKVPKDAVNKFGNYNYRTAESILRAFKEKNEELNLSLILMLSDEISFINNRFYVKAIVTLTDAEAKQSVFVSAFARETENKKGMDEAQVTGASSSYARKYALSGLLAIDDGKDPDSQEPATENKVAPKTKIDF